MLQKKKLSTTWPDCDGIVVRTLRMAKLVGKMHWLSSRRATLAAPVEVFDQVDAGLLVLDNQHVSAWLDLDPVSGQESVIRVSRRCISS